MVLQRTVCPINPALFHIVNYYIDWVRLLSHAVAVSSATGVDEFKKAFQISALFHLFFFLSNKSFQFLKRTEYAIKGG